MNLSKSRSLAGVFLVRAVFFVEPLQVALSLLEVAREGVREVAEALEDDAGWVEVWVVPGQREVL